MASIRKEVVINARPEAVWDALRDVGAIHVEREASVFQIERAWVQARRAAAEAGQRLAARGALGSPADTLFLTASELVAALRGDLEASAARRRIVSRREGRGLVERQPPG